MRTPDAGDKGNINLVAMASFRFNAKRAFLTYPQSGDLSLSSILDHAKSIADLQHYKIVKELHEDGSPHIHAILIYFNKLNLKNPRAFDVDGHHPKIEPVKSLKSALIYLDKDFIEKIESEEISNSIGRLPWGDILSATTKEAFLDSIKENYPRDFVLKNQDICAYAEKYFNEPTTYTPSFTNFHVPNELNDYYETYLADRGRSPPNPGRVQTVPIAGGGTSPDRVKSLFLISPSRFGKTEWARSHGDHAYFNHNINIDKFQPDQLYAVFDDMQLFSRERISYFKPFIGCQKEFDITDKYRHKRTLSWGRPSIFLMNLPEWNEIKNSNMYDYILTNSSIVILNTPLF